MSLRNVIDQARESGELVTISKEVDSNFELANVAHALEGSLVLFESIKEYPGWRVLSGQCADRRYLSMGLGIAPSGLVHHLAQAIAQATPPPLVEKAPCQEVIEPAVDLNTLPIPLHLPQDGGHYIASAVVIVKDPDLGRNMCYHRLLRLDARHFAARIIENRGTHTAMQKVDGDLPVAIGQHLFQL